MPIHAEGGTRRGPPSVATGAAIAGTDRTDATPASRTDGREIWLLQALSDAAREMHRSLSLDEVVHVAAQRARQILGAAEAATTQLDDTGAAAQSATSLAHDGPPRSLDPLAAQGGPAREVRRTNRPLRLAWTASGVDAAGTGTERHRTWLGAPLVGSHGRNLGLIQVAGKLRGGEFTAGDEAVLVQLARMASVAIENARLYEAALDTRSRLAWAAQIERIRAAEVRAVINAMGEAVLVCDAAGGVNIVNPAADALFAGRPVRSYTDLLSRFRPTEPEVNPVASAVELQLADDTGRWVELRVYLVPGAGAAAGETDDSGGRIAIMRDVTAARQARAQREAFLGILSHELRTPITTIYAGSKVLAREEPLDVATSRELANDISAEAERLFRLVEDLLVMTRIERGVLHLASEPVLLQRVVAAAIRIESSHWPTTRIRLAGPVDLPAVAGDATYVEQVVRNLLSNAAKYSPTDAEIEVRLGSGTEGVSCRVLDRGRGFRSDETDDLFDLFYRSPATAAQAAGAGIGLFVCRRLVTAMDGRIWARPRTGGGAEFGFALRPYEPDGE